LHRILQDPVNTASRLANFVLVLVQGQPNLLAQEFIMLSLIATLQTLGFNIKNRLHDEKGATAVEYGIMVGLIAVVIIVAVTTLGGQLNTMFTSVTAKL
jgi:pilus assembly protein Flp/PilA